MGLINKLLDYLILTSFDQSGFDRHRALYFDPQKWSVNNTNLSGKRILVTGSSSGIGYELAKELSFLKANVFGISRSQPNCDYFKTFSYDLSLCDFESSKAFLAIKSYLSEKPLDALVFNAGLMPQNLSFNEFGVETQWSVMLLGHYELLLTLKRLHLIKKNGSIIFVSSGGMYLKNLSLDEILKKQFLDEQGLKLIKYDKVKTYANCKRAQVILAKELSQHIEFKNFKFFSMHPGWVKTNALKEALTHFYHFFEKRLRSPLVGGDTIIDLIVYKDKKENGGFYFDRKKRRTSFLWFKNKQNDFVLKFLEEQLKTIKKTKKMTDKNRI